MIAQPDGKRQTEKSLKALPDGNRDEAFRLFSRASPYPRGLGGQLGELAHIVVITQLAGQSAGSLGEIAQAGATGIRRLAQDLGELRHHRK